ncbi:DivIVA domain-containing protein [Antricoccus suffuscus]|uniref:DivIVA domain-containing protein n=1 Tax=Antricoccus suffuscus TaxID=1629062 RepID=A0A2T0ZXM5_9ACTN|nr:DivIVA domain-containing protein [Antricoccus suffuscus]PRZ41034.1 DivIVA domain-containing protein [Antricoccus suffuscus]
MGEFLWVFFGLIVVSGLLYFVITVVFGPGEERVDSSPDSSPVVLPHGRVLAPEDLDKVRLPVAFRGYRMAEVDALLDRLSEELAIRDALARSPQPLGHDDSPEDPPPVP